MFLVTGATGALGTLVTAHLSERYEDTLLAATWHRAPPQPSQYESRVTWHQWSLEAPDVLSCGFENADFLVVLHFACTVKNDFRSVFNYDVPGTLGLVGLLSRCVAAPTLFVFVSSTAASDARSAYGFGKKDLEAKLARLGTKRLECRSVRVPIIESAKREFFHISQADFPEWFLRTSCVEDWVARRIAM